MRLAIDEGRFGEFRKSFERRFNPQEIS